MAKFYSEIYTERGNTVSRTGHKNIESHIRGWAHGIYISVNKLENGIEEYCVYETGGSNNPSKKKLVYRYLKEQ